MKKYNYVYLIRNNINGKIYVGKHSTDNLDDGYMGSGNLIKAAIKKYGIDNFTKVYLAFADTEQKLNWFEKFYIRKFNTQDQTIGYNLTAGGDGVLGLKHSEKAIQKMKDNSYWKGRHHSEDTKNKMSESHIKYYETHPELKQICAHKGEQNGMYGVHRYGEDHPMYGKHHSEESKAKMSETRKKMIKPFWITTDGNIVQMDKLNVRKWHSDWILYNKN